jgi:PadR family transcriptional regulator PadR
MGNTPRKTDLLPGTLELLILKTLERSPAHGYGIARGIEQSSGNVLRVEEGSLYPALQRLAVKGWVKSRWGQSENNRRARFYQLTPAGHRQLRREEADFELMLEAVLRVLQPA